jgi:hypothetical protein
MPVVAYFSKRPLTELLLSSGVSVEEVVAETSVVECIDPGGSNNPIR